MEVRVLGPVEVWHEDRQVPLARRMQRVILGILALEANHLVSAARLIDLLWGDHPPRSARAMVQSRISELRAILNGVDDARTRLSVESRGPAYTLRGDPECIDVLQFRTLIQRTYESDSDEVIRTTLRNALELWRGPVLGGQLREDTAAALGQALESSRLTAIEDLFEVELRLGNQDLVADELIELCIKHPGRERLVGQMMLALSRAGRNADALQGYENCRRWLSTELGIDPGHHLQQLYLSILNGDTSISIGGAGTRTVSASRDRGADESALARSSFTPSVPQTLPPSIPDFLGREKELAQLHDVLTGPPGTRLILVEGRAGVGKSALSVRAASLYSNQFPDGVLYADLLIGGNKPATPYDVIGRFLHALSVDGAAVPEAFEERLDLYRTLLFTRRVLVLLDNAVNDSQIFPLIPNGPECAAIINSRSRIGATFNIPMLELDVLDEKESIALLTRTLGEERVAAELAASVELTRRCGYLPLALRIVTAKLAAKPHEAIQHVVDLLNERQALDYLRYERLDIRSSISLSYQHLSAEARCLFRRIGEIGLPEITVWVSAALLDIDSGTAEELLEQLFDSQLIHVVSRDIDNRPRYRLHDLVRLFATERAELDETSSDLESAHIRVLGAWLFSVEAAYRSIHGDDYPLVPAAKPRWAVNQSTVKALSADPLRWFDAEFAGILIMIRRAAEQDHVTQCWNLACAVSPLFQMRRRFIEWRTALRTALQITEQSGDLYGQAAVHYRMGYVCADCREYDESWQHFQKAKELFGQAGDIRGQAAATAFTGMVDRFRGDNDRALARYAEALPVLHDSADHGGEALALRSIGQIYMERGDTQAADALFERALDIYRAIGGRQGEAQVLFWQSMLRIRQEKYDDAHDGFSRVLDTVQKLGDRPGQAQALRGIGLCYRCRGHTAQARATLSEALALAHQPRPTFLEEQILKTIADL